MRDKVEVPQDTKDWIKNTDGAEWFLYDLNLLPECIRTREQLNGLMCFIVGWKAAIKQGEKR
jgi:hypothetical protein